jgi:protein DJ-1
MSPPPEPASSGPKKHALVILAEGAEEIEVVVPVDVLRRAGVDVTLAGLDGPGVVTCSRGVRIAPDGALSEAVGPFDLVLLPGGRGGAERLAASEQVGELVRAREKAGQLVAAICAAPFALAEHGAFANRRMTAHPSVHEIVSAHATLTLGTVVVDDNLVTAPGPGASFDFALALVELLVGPERAAEVAAPMMLPEPE